MPNEVSSENLRKKYLAALEARADKPVVWRIFVEDKWFLAELRRHAEMVIRKSGHSMDLLVDVLQEVILNLGRRFEKSIFLGVDPATNIKNFESWIGTLMFNVCRDALRRLHVGRESSLEQSLDEVEARHVSAGRQQEQARELRLAIDELPQDQSTVLHMILSGESIEDTAERLQLRYKQAYALYCRAIDRLQQEFG